MLLFCRMALHFKYADKTSMTFLPANGSIGLGSLAVGLGCDPMGIMVGGISLDYNPATGQSQTFGAVLQHLRQSDGLLGTCPENPILLEGKALGEVCLGWMVCSILQFLFNDYMDQSCADLDNHCTSKQQRPVTSSSSVP